MHLKNKRIILSKINQIGDVIFALPLASAIKKLEPSAHIIFLGTQYTRELIEHYPDVDEFADWGAIYQDRDEITAAKNLQKLQADVIVHVMANKPAHIVCKVAKRAKIPIRIGTSHRWYTWLTCNRLVNIGRSKGKLHETQYDMMFMSALGGRKYYSLGEIIALRRFTPLPQTSSALKLLDPHRFNLILHPKTRGEHIEWQPAQFAALMRLLPKDQFKIFITGTQIEGDKIRAVMLDPFPEAVDLCGKITLSELMQLIQQADGLVCASTGPVHLAAAFGVHTLGLYAPIRPFHAERWGPVGKNATSISIDKACEACRDLSPCRCIWEIPVQQVLAVLMSWYYLKNFQRIG